MLIRKGSLIINLEKDPDESNETFIERCNFILNNKPENDKQLKELIMFSKIKVNIKYKKCVYDQKIVDRLREFIE